MYLLCPCSCTPAPSACVCVCLLLCHTANYLYLSSLGTGTYLGNADDMTDEQVLSAILYSASRGWNVIDTGECEREGTNTMGEGAGEGASSAPGAAAVVEG